MSNYNSSKFESSSALYRVQIAGTGYTVGDIVEFLYTQQSNALQESQWFNHTTRQPIAAPTLTHLIAVETFEQNQSQDIINQLVSANSQSLSYENQILAGQYGEATPNNFDILFQVDMRDVPNNQWLMLYATSSTQFNPNIGISVSNNGSNWDDLYQNGNYSVTVTDQQGGDISGTSFSLTTTNTGLQGNPIWIKPPTRFIRFVDVNGGSGLYALTAYSSVNPPRNIQDTALVSQVTNLNNTVSYLPDEDRLYRVLVASTGFSVGDIARRSTRSNFSSPNSPIFTQWSNDTQKTIGLTAPTLANLVVLTNAQDGQNVDRKLNNTASAFQLKATNALIKSIYIDNLGALMYLQVHQGLTAAPAAGAVPTEAYRIPANGSISFEFDRVYTGQVWLAFSTTVATFTASAVAKNIYTRFN